MTKLHEKKSVLVFFAAVVATVGIAGWSLCVYAQDDFGDWGEDTKDAATAVTAEAADAGEAVAEAADEEVVAEEDFSDVEMMPEELTMNEVVRRQEMRLLAEEEVQQASAAYQNDEFTDALKLYKSARAKLILAGRTAENLDQVAKLDAVMQQLYIDWADALAAEAADLANEEQFDDAIEKLNGAIAMEQDPERKKMLLDSVAQYREMKKVARFETQIAEENVDLGKEERLERISVLMEQGKVLHKNARLTDARDKFEEILTLDPYQIEAIRWLRKVNRTLQEVAKERQEMSRDERLAEIAWKWADPVRPLRSGSPRDVGGMNVEKLPDSKIQEKLREIIIPKIEFEEASIHQVVKFLKQKSKELDPEGIGVNFFLRLKGAEGEVGGGAPAAAAPPADLGGEDWGFDEDWGAPAAGGATPAATPGGPAGANTITMNMDNIRLGEAVKYICLGANLKYRVESNAVVIADRDLPEGDLITKFYPIKAGMFRMRRTQEAEALADAGWGAEEAGGDQDATDPEMVRKYFENLGVRFPEGATVAVDTQTSKLIVYNTEQNLQKIEEILRELNIQPTQVMIEAKFVEVNQGDVDAFGFEWVMSNGLGGANANFRLDGQQSNVNVVPQYEYDNVGEIIVEDGQNILLYDSRLTGYERIVEPSNNVFDTAFLNNAVRTLSGALGTGSSTGILSGAAVLGGMEMSWLMHAVSQSKSSDLLSAPKVTTVSGQTAIIRMVKERYFPESWTDPDVTTDDGTISITPSMPEFGDARDIGVVLEVTPVVESDGYTIALELRPQVNEFLGYDTENNSYAVIDDVPIEFKAQMPIIEARTVTTNVIIYDGETVVLGGMVRESVEEFSDKVPILGDLPLVGRLFQNRGESTEKRNLLIFVTARLVDPAGQAQRRQEALGLPDFRR